MPIKETIKPPTKRELTDAGKQARKRHPSGARVLAEESVAVHEGLRPKKLTPKRGTRKLVTRGKSLGVRATARKQPKKREYKRTAGKRS
jgi:hypothetical protein